MFDIDAYLEEIEIKTVSPSEKLVQQTKAAALGKKPRAASPAKPEPLPKFDAPRKQRKKRPYGRLLKPLSAVMMAAVLLFGFFMGSELLASRVAGAYTVDINPSVCVNVDKNDTVVSVKAQNADAKTLLADLDCVGLPASDAIEMIIGAAREAGYLDGDQKYVLVGRFGDNSEANLDELQQTLEVDLGDLVNFLLVSGTMEEKVEADELDVSAGLLKLSKIAGEGTPSGGEKVSDMVNKINETYDYYLAPALQAETANGGIDFFWSAIGFESFGYEGKVKYKLYAGKTEADILAFGGNKLASFEFESDGDQPLEYNLPLDTRNINANESRYYALYVYYGNGVVMSSNIVYATMPEPPAAATPKLEKNEDEDKDSGETPDTPNYTYTVSGYVSGANVVLTWDKAQGSGFEGYKIVASTTDATPKYPDNGYIRYITDVNATSKNLYEGYQGLKGDTYYYFSVTYLYSDGTMIAANAVRLKMPGSGGDGDDASDEAKVSTNISGSLGAAKVKLSWNKVSHSDFAGYKVVASKTNPNPKYPDDGYIAYITNADTTSLSKEFSAFDAGKTYYFSITVLYNDGTKKAGNAIALTIPSGSSTPEDPMTATAISGSQNGTSVNLSWNKVSHEKFSGYKVVASKTNPNPKYPDDGYIKYITNAGTTSYSTAVSNFEAGKTYYFSITVLYSDGTKKAGNALAIKMPETPEPTPEPEPEPEPYVSTSISGSINGNMVNLSWGKVTHPEFEGYKVVYSFTDSSPVYGESGTSYSHWITNASNTSVSVDITSLSGYAPGATCYFSITVLYDSHSVKKPGNTISFTAP